MTVRSWTGGTGESHRGPLPWGPVRAPIGQGLTAPEEMGERHGEPWLPSLPLTWEPISLWRVKSEALLHTRKIVSVTPSLWTLLRFKQILGKLVRERG